MVLQTPIGFGGSAMTDDDFGAITSTPGPMAIRTGFEVTQTNTSARTVDVSAGDSVAYGVRVRNVGTYSTAALTAPSSGQAWYLLALRRDWSAKTASVVVLAGTTSGTAAHPATPPSTFPATLQNSPGAGQLDQPLAWVSVISGSIPCAVFDARMWSDSAGGLTVPDPWALNAYISYPLLVSSMTQGGTPYSAPATIRMAQFSPNGPSDTSAVIRASQWMLRAGPGVAGVARPASVLQAANSGPITALGALLNGTLPRAQAFIDQTDVYVEGGSNAGITFRYRGAGTFKPWSKALTSFNPSWAGKTGGNGSESGLWWIESGVVHTKANFILGSTSSVSGGLTFNVPYGTPDATWGQGTGSCSIRDDSGGPSYYSAVVRLSGSTVALYAVGGTNTTTQVRAGTPITWATNDSIDVELTYVPA